MRGLFVTILLGLTLLIHSDLSGQCPDRSLLRERIAALKAKAASPDQQLKELLPYLPRLESCPRPMDSSFAIYLQRLAVLYYSKHDLINAANYTVRAIRILEEKCSGTATANAWSIKWYNHLRHFYDTLNRKKDMLAAIDSCVSIAVRSNMVDYDVLYNLWKKTYYYYDIGDYERCLKNASFGETLNRQYLTGVDSLQMALAFCDPAINALIALGRYDELEIILKTKIREFTPLGDQDALGMLLNQLSLLYTQKHDSQRALESLRQSYAINRSIGYDLGCAQALDNIGSIYLNDLKDHRTALIYFRKALRQLPANRRPYSDAAFEAVTDYDDIASVYLADGQTDSALYFIQKGFDQLTPGMQETDLLYNSLNELYLTKRTHYIIELIIHKADAYYDRWSMTRDSASLRAAITVYKRADLFLEKIRTEQAEILSQLAFRKNARNLYEHAIRATLAKNDPVDAFYFFERSRAILLNDKLDDQAALDEHGLSERAAVRRKILRLEKTMKGMPPDAPAYARLQTSLYTATQQSDRLDRSLRQLRLAAGKDPHYSPLYSFSSLQQYINSKHQSFLEIYAGDSAVYLLHIGANKASIHRLPVLTYDSLAAAYISLISDPERLNHDMPGFIRIASRLYHMLFPDGLPAGERILISPDGRYFPFEALVTDNQVREPSWFLYQHAACYTYSARYALGSMHQDTLSSGKGLLGIAPVQYAAYLHLPDLPGSNLSLDQIGSYFGATDKFIAKNATKDYFLQNFSQYRLIQLYTHAIGSQAGNEPLIYFADSALSLSELIPGTRPQTRLVVLSACETANGAFYQGEGVFSFNREFASLGIPASVVNCWSVDNKSTYRLTELFYKYLSGGDSTDIALQKAKIEFLRTSSRQQRLPYYWAAPILTGQATVLMTRHPLHGWPADLMIVMTLLLAIFFITRAKARRK